ncbi:MAG: (2Fe-2S)-binding protein [Elusimicrobia bacterium]|nr:(2Fe-2S)-binding protein [Elusimicrobiota bacterium]
MITLTVNGRRRRYAGPPFKRLLDVLRQDFGLTGTKEGCGEGECGACTVLVDGKPVASCLVPVCQIEGARVRTVESLGKAARLSALQKAFVERGGIQCGFCAPGILMTASAGPAPKSEDDARRKLAGHICRCTGYVHIVESLMAARRKK